jgi:hypothetical protein
VRKFLMCLAVGGLLGLLTPHGLAGGKLPQPGKTDLKKIADSGDGASCGKFGTSVEFVSTPSEAAKQALKEEKLVLVLHVSGNFETPDFT